MSKTTIHLGDCLHVLKTIPDNSIDSIVTDPPYGINFMNKGWDNQVPGVDVWAECLRVLKPGGHLLAFAGTRTQHHMATRIEDAGFEIRDMIAWVYGSGFPKSHDVSKAIDKAAGAEREVLGLNPHARPSDGEKFVNMGTKSHDPFITAPSTDEAKQWQGWGTALKPALEPITVARKPFTGTVANNVLQHGTGAINVDGCRVGTEDMSGQFDRNWNQDGTFGNGKRASQGKSCVPGRWPANFIHDGSDEVVELFPVTNPSRPGKRGEMNKGRHGGQADIGENKVAGTSYIRGHSDNGGSAARFFYCPKASTSDRNCSTEKNIHPTVKPTDLMAYLCRLVTPPGGTVLDPFMGSGSTGKAAVREGFNFIGIELSAEYFEIAQARINNENKE